MDNRYAYYTNDYAAQTRTMDAVLFACESSLLHYCIWNYCPDHSKLWGDNWNGEDFSIYHPPGHHDDHFYAKPHAFHTTFTLKKNAPPWKKRLREVDVAMSGPGEEEWWLTKMQEERRYTGTRGAAGWIRPYPILTAGSLIRAEFYPYGGFGYKHAKVFVLRFRSDDQCIERAPTIVYLPHYHFVPGMFLTHVSDGTYKYNAKKQYLYYWHTHTESTVVADERNHHTIVVVARRDLYDNLDRWI